MTNLITSSFQLIMPNYLVILSHQHSTMVSLENYPLIHLILYLVYYYYLKNNLIFLFFKTFFLIHDLICDPVCDLICDPVCDLIWSDAVQSWFCQCCCGFHILVNPSATTISVCISDLTVVHIHNCTRLCSTGAWLLKGT